MSESRHRTVECQDCHATRDSGHSRVIAAGPAGTTETWHTENCPHMTVTRILMEDSARQVREREAWASKAFPAAHERLKEAAATVPAGDAAAPFAAALVELVEAQGQNLGRFVTLDRWAEILERHFPPLDEEPAS